MKTESSDAPSVINAARRTAESGRELGPETIAALERIAEDPAHPDAVRLEAEILIGLEAMA